MDRFDDYSSEEEEEQEEGLSLKEQVIILIDAQAPMLEPANLPEPEFEGLSWLEVAARVAALVLRQKVIASSTDEAAVLLYGAAAGGGGLQSVHPLLDLGLPSAHAIQTLESLTKASFLAGIGSAENKTPAEALSEALWSAVTVGEGKASVRAVRRIMLFTTADTPTVVDGARWPQIATHLATLAARGTALQLFPLATPGGPTQFDLDPFWKPVLALVRGAAGGEGEGEEFSLEEEVGKLEDLRRVVRSRAHRKRAIARTTLELSPGHTLAVRLYALTRPQAKSSTVWVDGLTNEPVRVVTGLIDADIGAPIPPAAVAQRRVYPDPKAVKFDCRFPQVFVSEEEAAELRSVCPRTLRLLGFKPAACLREHHQLKPSTFVYPDEKAGPGSAVGFAALHSAMLARRVVAVFAFCRTPRSEPRLVAAVPAQETVDSYGAQLEPPGLHLIHLPWAEDVRGPEGDASFTGTLRVEPSEAAVAAAEALLSALHLDSFYSPNIPNPSLQRHYEVLESLALGSEPSAEVRDETLPDGEAFASEGVVAAIEAFKDAAYGEGYVEGPPPKAKGAAGGKRKAAGAAVDPGLAAAVEALNVEGLWAAGQLMSLTVPQLKQFLEAHGLPKSGAKTPLVERISDHLGATQAKPAP